MSNLGIVVLEKTVEECVKGFVLCDRIIETRTATQNGNHRLGKNDITSKTVSLKL